MNRGYVLSEMERYTLISKLKEAKTNLIKLSTTKVNRVNILSTLRLVDDALDVLTTNSGVVTKEA